MTSRVQRLAAAAFTGPLELAMQRTYLEKLKDPRWQRKRLEALNAAGFGCSVCGDAESPLHVHHRAYFKGREQPT